MKNSTVVIALVAILGLGAAAVLIGMQLANQANVEPTDTSADEPDVTTTVTVTPSTAVTTTTTVTTSVAPAVCGDGTVQLGEQCDDGNLINGDGCNSVCRIDTTDCAPVVETVNITIPGSAKGNCDWSRGTASSTVKGFRVRSTTLPLAGVCSLAGLRITNDPNKTFRYDDTFTVTINDIVLLSSHKAIYNALPSSGPFKIYGGRNSINNIKTPNINDRHNEKCLAPDCKVPISQRKGTFTLGTLTDNIQAQIFERIKDSEEILFRTIVTGDDDKDIDCQVPAITMQVQIETVPESCNCPEATPFCGDGNIDPGEECDAGLTTGQTCSAAPGTSCEYCTFQCTTGVIFTPADATPVPTTIILPETAVFGDTADTIIIGAILLMAGVWSYVLGLHLQIGRLFNYVSAAPDKAAEAVKEKKKEDFEDKLRNK